MAILSTTSGLGVERQVEALSRFPALKLKLNT
jgi:hypothetical protein